MDDLIRKGHFEFASGLHSKYYIEKSVLFENPQHLIPYIDKLVRHYDATKNKIDIVVGPLTYGAILAYEVARRLNKKCMVWERGIFRNSEQLNGKNVLIVDDVLTTGSTIISIDKTLQNCGADLFGVGVLFDRSNTKLTLPWFYAAEEIKFENYKPERCPLCKEGIELTRRIR